MPVASLGFGEEINNLDLNGKVVERDRPVMNRAPSKVGIHANVLGQLMLDWINSNLKGTSAVTVKRSGGGNRHTKILK